MSVWNDCPICGIEMALRSDTTQVLTCKSGHYAVVLEDQNYMKIRNDFIRGDKFCVSRWAGTTVIYFNYSPHPEPTDYIKLNKVLSIKECLNTNKLKTLFLFS